MKKYCLILALLAAGLPVFASGGLDSCVRQAASYLKGKLPNDGTKLAILSLNTSGLETYFVDELTIGLRNITTFQIVDRTQLDAIAAEMNFQMSGQVDDTDQARLGKMAGARRIVSVKITYIGQESIVFS